MGKPLHLSVYHKSIVSYLEGKTQRKAHSFTSWVQQRHTCAFTTVALDDSQFLQSPRVAQQLSCQPPSLLGRVLHGVRPLAFEQVQVGQKVVWAAFALQARNKL